MARKLIPAHPARDRSRDDESLLLRSAESLGRMIGSLQRQLDVATGRLAESRPDDMGRRNSGAKSSVKAKSGAMARGSANKNDARGGARKKSSVRKSAARSSAKKR
jgi:hypothetical protein